MSIFGDDWANQERERNRRNAEWKQYAKETFLPGIDPADLKPGMQVTLSPNLMVHDRSWANEVCVILAANCQNVQIKTRSFDQVVVSVHEHHFYDASDFVLTERSKQETGE